MAIEKMTFIDINGHSNYLDEVLTRCILSGLFQPEHAAKLSEYSIGSTALLRNPYGGIRVKISEIAQQLRIPLEYRTFESYHVRDREEFLRESNQTLDRMRKEYPAYFEKQNRIQDEIVSYSAALEMLGHIDTLDLDFDELWQGHFLKVRFGRLPTVNLPKLSVYDDKPYELHKLDANLGYTWCLYLTAAEYRNDIDEMFHSFGFERLRIPDYVHGTTVDAVTFIQDGLRGERQKLEEASAEIEAFVVREREAFLSLYSKIKLLHDAYDLRKYVVRIRDHFHLIGFVLKKEEKNFTSLFADLTELSVQASPAGSDSRLPPPVRLKNNWFVRPFEMFVNMYGSPSYNDIDPSPFVAYTYSLLFGMMFGDLGQGLCVCLLGLFLWHTRKMQLGAIMSRIGVSSMVFGFLYGSVFGFEHLLDGFYTGVLGLASKPVEVMRPDTTNNILIAAIGIGVALIFMVIIFNIVIGVKHRDFDRAVLSHNGVAGLILYGTVLAVALETVTKTKLLTTFGETILIVFPLILVFFREPITHLIKYQSTSDILRSDKRLSESTDFHDGSINIQELFSSQYVKARFGRLPTDSYRKLMFYQNEPFMLYPVKTEHDYIWCIYAMALANKEEIDAIFHDLYFERLFIPEDQLCTNEMAEAYIKRCVAAGGTPQDDMTADTNPKYGPVRISHSKTAMEAMFPDGLGAFLTQTFFELFEVILSFITNTMSFLRVGGFILAHAGMMAVVFTLAGMVGSGASPVVIVVGNLFVMALEGLIVGIQVLRLEFYEIFSRFFDASGEPFKPVVIRFEEANA